MSKRAIKDECASLKEKVKTLQKAAGKVPAFTKKRKEADDKVKAARKELRDCKAARRDIPALILIKATLRAREDAGLAKNTGWQDVPIRPMGEKEEAKWAGKVGGKTLADAVTKLEKKNKQDGIYDAVSLASAEMFAEKVRKDRTLGVGIAVGVLVVAAVVLVVVLTAGAAAPAAGAAAAGTGAGGAGAGGAAAGGGAAAAGSGTAAVAGKGAAVAGGAATAAEGAKASKGLFKGGKAAKTAADAASAAAQAAPGVGTEEAADVLDQSAKVMKEGGPGVGTKLAELALKAKGLYTQEIKRIRGGGKASMAPISTYDPGAEVASGGGEEDEETPWFKNPVVIGGSVVAVTGIGLLVWKLSSSNKT